MALLNRDFAKALVMSLSPEVLWTSVHRLSDISLMSWNTELRDSNKKRKLLSLSGNLCEDRMQSGRQIHRIQSGRHMHLPNPGAIIHVVDIAGEAVLPAIRLT
jgi:hypothetical protein